MNDIQRPLGPKDLDCPLHRKSMAKVCHRCPLWIQVRGKLPQSNEEVDHWGCSLSWMPQLMIENSQQQRQTAAAVESFRNEMVELNTATLALQASPSDDALRGQAIALVVNAANKRLGK